jgi:molybdopterin biosynthesis enzyme
LPPGADAATNVPLRRAGQRLRALDIGVLTVAGGRQNVMVRAPRVRVFLGIMRSPPKTDAVAKFIGRAVAAAGAVVLDGPLEALSFRQQVTDDNVDGAIVVGGTGTGRSDQTVRDLAVHGQLAVHGMAISPGETAALGFVQSKPVLIVPGRFDAALAAWLLVGRYLIAGLSGESLNDAVPTLPLKRKVASAIGLTEVIPVRCAGGMAEPLGSGYLSFTALSHSDGWISVAAESEGLPAGAPVAMQPWP